jgi:hypothetical protein
MNTETKNLFSDCDEAVRRNDVLLAGYTQILALLDTPGDLQKKQIIDIITDTLGKISSTFKPLLDAPKNP